MAESKAFVIVESPYAGDLERNTAYARAALHDCLIRGEAPFASHLLYTQPGVLRDEVADERRLGIEAGLELARRADRTVVYCDLAISKGMWLGIKAAQEAGRPVEFRSLLGAGFEPPGLEEATREALAFHAECHRECDCEWAAEVTTRLLDLAAARRNGTGRG